ncbi:MAG: peptidoglycan DD-metalloendopeptidase family protein [Proteobacteria bacterium]|nr:peptidoglycan DD-metalloendopeptidase family protein [Pseudomonadota bacterium]
MFKATIFLLFVFLATIQGHSAQKNVNNKSEVEIEANIQNIQKKLKILKTKLNKAYGQEQLLLEKLESQDKNISSIVKKINISSEQIKSLLKEITQISQKISEDKNSIEIQKNQIVKLLKLQIYLNHDKTLKMLLASPQNSHIADTKHQIKYLQNRLYNLIKEVAVNIQQLEVLKTNQQELKSQENLKKQNLLLQKDTLDEQRNIRLKTLNTLKNEIAKHESNSEGLSKDQSRLQELLDEIQVLLSDLPADLGLNKPFARLKGKLSKPVVGAYIRSFRSRRSENTRWNGVVIKADLGQQVKAIAYGRIAFADWLRGFGMLIIIDHQDGYMSLYGFNESISVEVGDWVGSRENIATIGNSGTLATPAVYFEIRKNAKPLNPKAWVK